MAVKEVVFIWCIGLLNFVSSGEVSAGSNYVYPVTQTVSLNGPSWIVTNKNRSINLASTVPGGIYTDLLRGGLISDPYYRDNDILYKWISRDNWTFYRRFQIDESLFSKGRIILVCHGLDTVAKVTLNGQLLGTTDNMFIGYQFDVKQILVAGNNTISIAFQSAVEYARRKHEEQLAHYVIPPTCPPPTQKGECHINFIRKMQSSFSWDWGPAFPSQGIWKDIELEAYDAAKLKHVTITTDPISFNRSSPRWRLGIKAYFDIASFQQFKGQIRISLAGSTISTFATVLQPLNSTLQAVVNFTIDIPETMQIKTWWPNGYGNQPLYDVNVEYVDQATQESTSKTVTIGFRTVKLIQRPIVNATGLSFFFQVNDVPIFAKGSNWIPADSFPERITDDYVEYLLQSARDSHMNMLRVWGGGIYESEALYRIADEMGILLWQDLMFACALYPVREQFLESVTTEVTQQIRRIQHHPSVLLWAANNENEAAIAQVWWPQISRDPELYKSDYRKLYIDTIRPIVLREDPSRTFLSSSPSNGKKTESEKWLSDNPADEKWGDVHFYDYLADAWNPQTFPVPRFASEYGYQSFPSFETLRNVSLPTDWTYPYSSFLTHRQHSQFNMAGIQMVESIRRHLFSPRSQGGEQSYRDLLYLSQIVQAMSIKTETEHYRRHRSSLLDSRGKTMGALYWQLNDIWQAPTWSSIEYGGKWKMLQYFAKRFFAPILVSPVTTNGTLDVFVVSDDLQSRGSLTLQMDVYSWSSLQSRLRVAVKNFEHFPQAAVQIYTYPLTGSNGLFKKADCEGIFDCFVYARLIDDRGIEISNNYEFLAPFSQVQGIRKANIQLSNVVQTGPKTFNVTLTTDNMAPFVWLNALDIKGEFSDNGFLLVVPELTVNFTARNAISLQQFNNALSVKSLMDVQRDSALFTS